MQTEEIWRKSLLLLDSTISQAILNLDESATKIVLVVNNLGILQATISDGDIRRGLLKGLELNSPITDILHRNPLVVPPDMELDMVRQLMKANKIYQIPIVDDGHHVIGLHFWHEVSDIPMRTNAMVIMAGGMGKRLLPFTESCPKPLLRISGKPMLEHIINRAKLEGFNHFVLAINYLGNMIEEYFGDGEFLGVRIDYLREDIPLGTAGALGLFKLPTNEPFVVTNGDVMTDIRYGQLLEFHVRHSATATMAVRTHEWQHPFGVVQTDGVEIIGFEEKPILRNYINAGVYVLNPEVLDFLNGKDRCDMPSLFELLKVKERRIVAYPMHEPWLDVGSPEDYRLSNSARG